MIMTDRVISGVFAASTLRRAIKENRLNLPESRQLWGTMLYFPMYLLGMRLFKSNLILGSL